jgi:uncharacterized membrane protein YiaA
MKQKPSMAFTAVSWVVLLIGIPGYIISQLNAQMQLNEKGWYAFAFLLSIFGAIAVQKNTSEHHTLEAETADINKGE